MKLDLEAIGITILSTAEAIRKRPTMYVGNLENPKLFTKLIIETMCLSRARVANGEATQIYVRVADNNEIMISDNGRGMSMEPYGPVGNKTLLEKLLTELYACRNIKHEDMQAFCENGIVVVNALSEYFSVTNMVNNLTYIISYMNGELEKSPMICNIAAKDGLDFNFKFDPIIFGELKIDRQDLITEIDKIKSVTPAKIDLIFAS